MTDRTPPQGSEGTGGVFDLPSAALYFASSSFCFCCSMAACAAAESCLSTHVFTFSPDSRSWEYATQVSSKSVVVAATKVLIGSHPVAWATIIYSGIGQLPATRKLIQEPRRQPRYCSISDVSLSNSQPGAIFADFALPERPNTGWTDDDVVAGRQSAWRSAGDRGARCRNGLAAQNRAGDAGGRLCRRGSRMMVAGRMGNAVLCGRCNCARCKSGRHTKKSEREKNSSHQTPPSNSFRYEQRRRASKVSRARTRRARRPLP